MDSYYFAKLIFEIFLSVNSSVEKKWSFVIFQSKIVNHCGFWNSLKQISQLKWAMKIEVFNNAEATYVESVNKIRKML